MAIPWPAAEGVIGRFPGEKLTPCFKDFFKRQHTVLAILILGLQALPWWNRGYQYGRRKTDKSPGCLAAEVL
jgi:hypothetical protein